MSSPSKCLAPTPHNASKANPGPLGLAGFGITTVVLSCINAGVLPAESVYAVIPLALAFGGLAQLITGVLEFVNGNTFGTVAFTSYGAFWCWWASMKILVAANLIKEPSAKGVGITLLMWGVFTFYLWICTFKSSKALWTLFLILSITFFLLASADFGWETGKHLGGCVGIATGILALYISFAEIANAMFGREVLPVGKPFVC